MLRACPHLQELRVIWLDVPQSQTLASHTQKMVPEAFGDTFCEALATSCPQLQVFERDAMGSAGYSISSFTDRSMLALADMRLLEKVKLARVTITSKRLFELVVNHKVLQVSDNRHRIREYEISLGDNSQLSDTGMTFYVVLLVFLEQLAANEEQLPIDSLRVSLHLTNGFARTVSEPWSTEYYQKLQQLITKVRATHPQIKLRGLLIEQSGDGFKELREFTVSTGDLPDCEWPRRKQDENLEDSPLDEVFTNRTSRSKYDWETRAVETAMTIARGTGTTGTTAKYKS